MSRLLDIIVPHHNEPLSVIKPFFDILENQKAIDFDDFRILLINNGDTETPDIKELFGYKNLNIFQTQVTENQGVSYSRNYGLDHSDSKWVCFCDCDDCYTSIFSLAMLFDGLKKDDSDNYDLIWSPIYMQSDKDLVESSAYNNVFIHNKYYRRSYLIENNLRFNESLWMSEDSAFNTFVTLGMKKGRLGQINVKTPIYSWCRRDDSVSKNYKNWTNIAEGHFDRNIYVLEECLRKGYSGTEVVTLRTITDAYSMLTRSIATIDQTKFKKRIADFYFKHKETYDSASGDLINKAIGASDRDAMVTTEDIQNRPSLKEWLAEVLSQSEQPLK